MAKYDMETTLTEREEQNLKLALTGIMHGPWVVPEHKSDYVTLMLYTTTGRILTEIPREMLSGDQIPLRFYLEGLVENVRYVSPEVDALRCQFQIWGDE